jgi:hypothetical protein
MLHPYIIGNYMEHNEQLQDGITPKQDSDVPEHHEETSNTSTQQDILTQEPTINGVPAKSRKRYIIVSVLFIIIAIVVIYTFTASNHKPIPISISNLPNSISKANIKFNIDNSPNSSIVYSNSSTCNYVGAYNTFSSGGEYSNISNYANGIANGSINGVFYADAGIEIINASFLGNYTRMFNSNRGYCDPEIGVMEKYSRNVAVSNESYSGFKGYLIQITNVSPKGLEYFVPGFNNKTGIATPIDIYMSTMLYKNMEIGAMEIGAPVSMNTTLIINYTNRLLHEAIYGIT